MRFFWPGVPYLILISGAIGLMPWAISGISVYGWSWRRILGVITGAISLLLLFILIFHERELQGYFFSTFGIKP